MLTLAFETQEAEQAQHPVARWQLSDPRMPEEDPNILPEFWPWSLNHPEHLVFVNKFWETYIEQVVHFAEIAENEEVDIYSLGTETDRLFRSRYGGSGFIGQHLVRKIDTVYINGDLKMNDDLSQLCDIRQPITIELDEPIETIYNLVVIHKTPGHEYHEYFETNIKGAENVCNFAREQNINTIVFTSSIAPYGTWEDEKTEESLPLPTSAYGSSKLVAEEIHKRWQAEKPNERKLIIVRPGVVFGQNEGGNFTRLYKSMKKGQFFYPGRKDTKKAAIYVRDLVRLMVEMVAKEKPGVHLYNTVYTPIHSIEDICKTMAKVTDAKEPKLTIPSGALKLLAHTIKGIGKLVGKSFDGIHPDRVKKLMISTNINGQKLLDHGYKMEYSLEEAISDWWNDCNQEGLY